MPDSHVLQSNLEVDDSTCADTDSAYNESIGSASYATSLASSIKDYKYENGRRYHAYHEGAYVVPNDEEEQDRMDLLHHIYCLSLKGELHLAPVKHPQRVLDLGTGTGIWAIQFADDNPPAQVTGTDLSPIQPPWVPPNCQFEVDNFEDVWLYKNKFDFVHGRELEGCIANEERLFEQAFEHLKPGGYFEISGAYAYFLSDDETHRKAESSALYLEQARAAGEKFGKSFEGVKTWKDKMSAAGFVNVTETVVKIPIGSWPKDPKMKEIGRFQKLQQIQAVEAYGPALFVRVLGWDRLEMEVLVAKVRNELKDRSLHLYIPVHIVYGQKPGMVGNDS